MSTKTSIKRIAAVAAVALTLGGFSAVSAHATAPAVGGNAGVNQTSSVVTGTYKAITITPGSSDAYYTITSAGVGSVFFPATSTGNTLTTSGATTIWSQGTGAVGTGSGASWSGTLLVSALSATAGTQTITVTGNVSTAVTYTITWGAAQTVSAANSTAIFNTAASGVLNATTDGTAVVSKAINTVAGTIKVVINGSDGAAFTNGTATIGASIAGSGLVVVNTNANLTDTGTARTSSFAANTAYVHVSADGTAGTGTITVTATDPNTGTSVVVATKTVTFFGSLAALTATQNLSVASTAGATLGYTGAASSASNVPAVVIKAVDSAGNLVKGLTGGNFGATSSDSTVMSSTITATEDTGLNGSGYYNVQVTSIAAASGKSATLTFWYSTDSGVTKISTSPVTFTLGGTTIASVAVTFDQATYAPGDKVTATLTAKDSSGNPVADGAYGIFSDASPASFAGFATSAQITSAIFAETAALTLSKGTATSTFYAPYADGTVNVSATLPATNTNSGLAAALEGTKVTGSFAVTNPSSAASQAAVDAANEATDAANAATDAANNAMDSADAAQQAALDAGDKADAALAAVTDLATKVSAIASQIASLSALVKKIAAKVKA
jgi:hypothetical protein